MILESLWFTIFETVEVETPASLAMSLMFMDLLAESCIPVPCAVVARKYCLIRTDFQFTRLLAPVLHFPLLESVDSLLGRLIG